MQGKAPTRVTLQRYYRPEDISRDQAYRASFREVYSSAQEETLDVDDLIGRCTVVAAASTCGGSWGQCHQLTLLPNGGCGCQPAVWGSSAAVCCDQLCQCL